MLDLKCFFINIGDQWELCFTYINKTFQLEVDNIIPSLSTLLYIFIKIALNKNNKLLFYIYVSMLKIILNKKIYQIILRMF